MKTLKLLSGGAAQGLVKGLAQAFKTTPQFEVEGEFGAVGAMADKLRNGVPADAVILTTAIIAALSKENRIEPDSIRDIGLVETALAVRARDPKLSVSDASSLREALLASDAIFIPDVRASTAGIHVAKVLDQLGITEEVASRLKIFPNGATAMRHLAESDAQRPVGCTQSTEIISTSGVMLSGPLPTGYDLATMYTAAVTTGATAGPEARQLIDLMAGAETAELRGRAGFASR